MAEHPLCADRCTLLADALAALAVQHGKSERAERNDWGVSPEFVPPVPRAPTAAALRWLSDPQFTD